MRQAGRSAPLLAKEVREEKRERDRDRRARGGLESHRDARDDRRRRARLRGLGDLLDRAPAPRRVVLGDEDEGQAREDADDPGVEEPVAGALLVEHRVRDDPHAGDRERDGDVVAGVETRHGAAAIASANGENPNDTGDEAEATNDQREEDPGHVMRHGVDRHPQDHRSDVLGGSRLEEVRATTRAVTDVVADEIGDDSGISRIVFRNSCLDLADKVGTQVRRLRVDAAAQLGEERDEGRAETKANDGERRLVRVREPAVGDEHHEYADERESHHEDP